MDRDIDQMSDRALLEQIVLDQRKFLQRLEAQERTLGQVNTGLFAIQDRVHLAELRDNVTEQRDRNYACRFVNFWIPEDIQGQDKDQRAACFWLYQKFIKPAFIEAQKVHGDMVSRIPAFLDIWDAGHQVPVKNHPDNEPFPFIFKFSTRGYLDMFLEFATSVVRLYNEANGEVISIRKDLTAVNRTCMSRLHSFTGDGEEAQVQDYWITGTTIKFTYKEKDGVRSKAPPKVYQVNNPFALTPREMAKFPPKKFVITDLTELASGEFQPDKRNKAPPAHHQHQDGGSGRGAGGTRGNTRGGRGGRGRGGGGGGRENGNNSGSANNNYGGARGKGDRGGAGGRGGAGRGGNNRSGTSSGASGNENRRGRRGGRGGNGGFFDPNAVHNNTRLRSTYGKPSGERSGQEGRGEPTKGGAQRQPEVDVIESTAGPSKVTTRSQQNC